jgi:hypothetical protein
MRTSDLTGAALDWAVAKCEGKNVDPWHAALSGWLNEHRYSADWAQGGPIIEREKLDVCIHKPTHQWCSATQSSVGRFARGYGPTPLVAAMRCYVASKLGDEVDIPEELT